MYTRKTADMCYGRGGIECAHWTTCSDAAGDGTPTCEAPSGGGGGSVCIGCVSSVGTAQGMHDVTNLKVNLTSPTTASLTWSYGDGRTCPNRGGTYIFVGTDKSAVDNNCGLPGGSFGS